MSKLLRVLIIEDSEDDTLLTIRALKKGGYDPEYECVETAEAMHTALGEKTWDVILCDYQMPSFNGLAAIALLKDTGIDIPLIIVSGAIGEETAVACMKAGAHDYVMKGNLSRLVPAIERELREVESRVQRKKVEEKLFQRNKRLDLAQSVAKAGVWDWDIVTGHIEWSHHLFSLFGLDPQKTTASFEAWRSAIHPEDVEIAGHHIDEALKERIRLNSDYRIILPDGQMRWINAAGEGEYDDQGRPFRMTGICLDITERKRMEEVLRENEEQYRSLFENASEAIFVAQDGKLVFLNPMTTMMTGYSGEELMTKPFIEFIQPVDREMVIDRHVRRMKGEDIPDLYSFRIISREGKIKWVELNAVLIHWKGEPATLNFLSDITERKRAEATLEDQLHFLQTLIDTIPSPIFYKDTHGVYLGSNKAFEQYIGIPKEGIVGKSVYDIAPKDLADKYNDYDQALLQNPGIQKYETDVVYADGSRHNVIFNKATFTSTDRQLAGLVGMIIDITELKQAGEILKETNEILDTIIQSSPLAIIVLDPDGNVTRWNPAAEQMFGWIESEVMGKFLPIVSEDKRDENRKLRERVLRGESFTNIEISRRKKDGSPIDISISTAPLRDSQGLVTGIMSVSADITDRKRSEELLKQSEERYRTILEEMEEGYQEVDLSGNFTFCNESFCKIFGYSENELLGSSFRRYAANKETADRVYRAYNQMYETGDALKRFEWDIIAKEGVRRSIEFSASLLRDGEGHGRGFRGIVRDVTERRSMEEQYRTMANGAQMGVYIVQDGRLCFVNPHIPSYSGYSEEELIGERVLHFVHPEDRDMVRAKTRKMLAGELKAPYEYRIVDKNKQVRWLMETVTPISYKGRSAVLGNTMDTTERKQTEAELQRTLESLRKAINTTIQVMISAVEVRDPYTAGHQTRVTGLGRAVATEMGLSQVTIEAIRMAGPIHDIGKLSVPAEILSKPTKLTEIEFSLIKEHARTGYEMLKDVESPWPLAEIVYQHHERMDGSGYPRHMKGDDILMEARIMAVADVVESMASHRPYRPSLGLNAAMSEIENNKGTLYDADVVDACLKLFRDKGYQLQ